MNYHNISDLWSTYLLPSGAALAVFYLLYKGLVRNDGHLNSRQFLILGFLIFAMILPFLHFEIPENTVFLHSESTEIGTTMPSINPTNDAAWTTHAASLQNRLINIFSWIYLIGVLIFVGRGIFGIRRLTQLSRNGKSIQINGSTVILGSNQSVAFSFFNRIFIPKTWYNGEERDFVLRHEQVHVKQKHSWDLMLMELVCAMQFFNPFAWLLKREMRLNHEYLADRSALENGGDKHLYFQLLAQKTIGKQPILVHSFNYSSLKHRIMMQISKPANLLSQARYLAFVPLALVLTFLFACQGKPATSEDINFSENTETSKEPLIIVNGEEFQGSLENADSTFINDILSCTVLKDSVAIVQYGQRGANGVVIITTKSEKPKKQQETTKLYKEDLENQIFAVVEIKPSYPDGEAARLKYLVENLKYPQEAREKNIQGTVYTHFVVERDGGISNIKILRGIGGGCDEETIRVIKNMPAWMPGKQRGQIVRTRFSMPVKFTLSEDGKEKS